MVMDRPGTAGGGQDESWAPEEVWKAQALGSGLWEVHVERGTREAMEKQSNAERLRRAEVLESQGCKSARTRTLVTGR